MKQLTQLILLSYSTIHDAEKNIHFQQPTRQKMLFFWMKTPPICPQYNCKCVFLFSNSLRTSRKIIHYKSLCYMIKAPGVISPYEFNWDTPNKFNCRYFYAQDIVSDLLNIYSNRFYSSLSYPSSFSFNQINQTLNTSVTQFNSTVVISWKKLKRSDVSGTLPSFI